MLVYLAAPYTSPSAELQRLRVESCRQIVYQLGLNKTDEAIYSPLVYGTAVDPQGDISWEQWMRHCFVILYRCQRMVVVELPGWEQSRGLALERKEWTNTEKLSILHPPEVIAMIGSGLYMRQQALVAQMASAEVEA